MLRSTPVLCVAILLIASSANASFLSLRRNLRQSSVFEQPKMQHTPTLDSALRQQGFAEVIERAAARAQSNQGNAQASAAVSAGNDTGMLGLSIVNGGLLGDSVEVLAQQLNSALTARPSFRQILNNTAPSVNATAAEQLQEWWKGVQMQVVDWINSTAGSETITNVCGMWDQVKPQYSLNLPTNPLAEGDSTAVYGLLDVVCVALDPKFAANEKKRRESRPEGLGLLGGLGATSSLNVTNLGTGAILQNITGNLPSGLGQMVESFQERLNATVNRFAGQP